MEKKGLLQNGADGNGPGQGEDGNDGIKLAAARDGDGAGDDGKGGDGGAPTLDDIQAARDAQWKALKDSGRITDPARVQTALNEAKAALVKARETHRDNPDALAARTREIVAAFVQATKGAVADRVTGRKLLALIQSPAFTAYPDDNAGDDALKTLTGTTPTATAAAKKVRDEETNWNSSSTPSGPPATTLDAVRRETRKRLKTETGKIAAKGRSVPALYQKQIDDALKDGAALMKAAGGDRVKMQEARRITLTRLARIHATAARALTKRLKSRASLSAPLSPSRLWHHEAIKRYVLSDRFGTEDPVAAVDRKVGARTAN